MELVYNYILYNNQWIQKLSQSNDKFVYIEQIIQIQMHFSLVSYWDKM